MTADRIPFRIAPEVCLQLALLLLLIPLHWLAAWIAAACIHELCHLIAIWLCGVPVQRIIIGFSGARIHTGPMTGKQEFFCALAGPFGAMLTIMYARQIPVTALFCCAQSLYNLLPIYPLDGGRALRCILRPIGSKGEKVEQIIKRLTIGTIFAAGFAACIVFRCIWLGAVLGLGVYLQCIRRKIPCKPGADQVQ